MKVAILTIEQKDILLEQKFSTKEFFNPVQDVNGDWVISEIEVTRCRIPNFIWVKDLLLTDWLGSYVQPTTGE